MGKKNWPKSAKKSQNSFSGLRRPCLRAGPKGQPQARRRCGPEGPAPEAPRLPAEGRQASIQDSSKRSKMRFFRFLGPFVQEDYKSQTNLEED